MVRSERWMHTRQLPLPGWLALQGDRGPNPRARPSLPISLFAKSSEVFVFRIVRTRTAMARAATLTYLFLLEILALSLSSVDTRSVSAANPSNADDAERDRESAAC
jgi:hypothetical protein